MGHSPSTTADRDLEISGDVLHEKLPVRLDIYGVYHAAASTCTNISGDIELLSLGEIGIRALCFCLETFSDGLLNAWGLVGYLQYSWACASPVVPADPDGQVQTYRNLQGQRVALDVQLTATSAGVRERLSGSIQQVSARYDALLEEMLLRIRSEEFRLLLQRRGLTEQRSVVALAGGPLREVALPPRVETILLAHELTGGTARSPQTPHAPYRGVMPVSMARMVESWANTTTYPGDRCEVVVLQDSDTPEIAETALLLWEVGPHGDMHLLSNALEAARRL